MKGFKILLSEHPGHPDQSVHGNWAKGKKKSKKVTASKRKKEVETKVGSIKGVRRMLQGLYRSGKYPRGAPPPWRL